MPKGMADGTDYAKYYNAAAAGEQVVGEASTRRPIWAGETQGTIDYSGGTGASSKSSVCWQCIII